MRVAVVGSGPAGFYAVAQLLACEQPEFSVDLFERLPTPFGLVRAGVAPDHPKIKAVTRAFDRTAQHDRFRFHGGVELGSDVTRDELRGSYHAVVYAIGTAADRRLGIPGESWPARTPRRSSSPGTTAIPTTTISSSICCGRNESS